jgi:hypothetical protein
LPVRLSIASARWSTGLVDGDRQGKPGAVMDRQDDVTRQADASRFDAMRVIK